MFIGLFSFYLNRTGEKRWEDWEEEQEDDMQQLVIYLTLFVFLSDFGVF